LKTIVIKIPAIIITIISWYLSSKSTLPVSDIQISDKIIHLVCFSGLAFWWGFWFSPKSWNIKPLTNFLLVVLITSGYGIIDEIHQYFVPGRSASLLDWLSDTFGGVIGGFLSGLFLRFVYRKNR